MDSTKFPVILYILLILSKKEEKKGDRIYRINRMKVSGLKSPVSNLSEP